MTTPTSASTNKTALRASLKKEDESLAERLVATDIPLVATPEPEAPVVAPSPRRASPPPLAAAPARKAAAKPAAAKPDTAKGGRQSGSAAKPAADVVPTPSRESARQGGEEGGCRDGRRRESSRCRLPQRKRSPRAGKRPSKPSRRRPSPQKPGQTCESGDEGQRSRCASDGNGCCRQESRQAGQR
jgi:hypothetical protein